MIQVKELSKIYSSKKKEVIALNGISLEIPEKKFVLIKGPSGCGKSTLMFALGGMLCPSAGTIAVGGENIYKKSKAELNTYRSQKIGFVFQSYYLIPYLSVKDNILFGLTRKAKGSLNERVTQLIEELHLPERIQHNPGELSIGEKQRVALARALVNNPDLILADEPTGNLDPDNAKVVLKHLNKFKLNGGTVIMVSHSDDADHLADLIIHMKQGKIESIESTNKTVFKC